MTAFDWNFPYSSQRMPVLAKNAVATSQPLATQAGISMLQKGGNAVDAALAAAITLTVVEPTSNGIGSDAFAIVWDGKKLHGLNGSGRSPAGWTPARFAKFTSMPMKGWDCITVPGAVSAWAELSIRLGKLDFPALFEPAIRYARDGYLVSPITARAWSNAVNSYKDFPAFAATFLPDGRAPLAGEKFSSKDHARTLGLIAESRGEAFYHGELAHKIADCSKAADGAMTLDDLAAHKADWVDTICGDFAGQTLHEIPPNGQGIAAIIALGILEHTHIRDYPADSADSLHVQLEAMKLAFADAYRYVSDADTMDVSHAALLDDGYLEERARMIDMAAAGNPGHGIPKRGGTVYLTAADSSGMMVSFIQSNFNGFGSGIVIPGTGIAMQNRGSGFTLEKGHPNEVGPNKRPYHTIIPGFVMKDGAPVMSFGVMGGPMQPQGHVQMMVRIFVYGQNPQAASDAPRWRVLEGGKVWLEPGFKQEVVDELKHRGHQIEVRKPADFGGAQLILKLEDGYLAASDHRKDGCAAGF